MKKNILLLLLFVWTIPSVSSDIKGYECSVVEGYELDSKGRFKLTEELSIPALKFIGTRFHVDQSTGRITGFPIEYKGINHELLKIRVIDKIKPLESSFDVLYIEPPYNHVKLITIQSYLKDNYVPFQMKYSFGLTYTGLCSKVYK